MKDVCVKAGDIVEFLHCPEDGKFEVGTCEVVDIDTQLVWVTQVKMPSRPKFDIERLCGLPRHLGRKSCQPKGKDRAVQHDIIAWSVRR